jgi:hypothetical protein
VGTPLYSPDFVFYIERAPAIILELTDLDGICSRQAKHEFGRISQVLTTAVVLVMVCPHEIHVLQVLIGEVLLRSVLHSERVLE